MARRDSIEWELIEADFRGTSTPLRAIAKKWGISLSTLSKRIKDFGWERDAKELVASRARAKLAKKASDEAIKKAKQESEQSVRESVQESAQKVISGLDAVVDRRVEVLSAHQEQAQAMRETIARAHVELAAQIGGDTQSLDRIAALLEAQDPKGAIELRKLMSLGSQIANLKNLTEAFGKVMVAERVANDIKDDDGKASGTEIDEAIKRVHETEARLREEGRLDAA